MINVIVPINLSNRSKKEITSVVRSFNTVPVDLKLLHCFEPISEVQSSLVNMQDLVYREKVKQMSALVEALRQSLTNPISKIKGKVRYGSLSNCIIESKVSSLDLLILIGADSLKEYPVLKRNITGFKAILRIDDLSKELVFQEDVASPFIEEVLALFTDFKIDEIASNHYQLL